MTSRLAQISLLASLLAGSPAVSQELQRGYAALPSAEAVPTGNWASPMQNVRRLPPIDRAAVPPWIEQDALPSPVQQAALLQPTEHAAPPYVAEPYRLPEGTDPPPPDPSGLLPQDVDVPPAEAPEAASDEAVVVEPEPEPPPEVWEGNFELGLDGSEGNSQRFNFRLGMEAKRKTDVDVLKLDLDYHKNTSHSEETAHRTFFDWRYEWLFPDSPWTWFAHGTVDYDEFKAFDVRVAIDTGLGYQFIDTEKTSLLGRCGGGWSREVGGPEDDYVPEATFGAEFEHQFSPRQKLTATVDYTPDVGDFRDFRLNTKAGWELLLDAEMNLSLKLSVLDRYDSTPHEAKANDVDYSVTLLWKF
jgi:putative salt-induced outer membrane protein YdiY